MMNLTANDFVLVMAGIVVILGVIAFLIGLITLAFKVGGGDFSEISTTSAKIMNKGLTDDVADLMGNASSLLQSITQMTKTRAGVGMFLIIISFILFVVSYYLVTTIL